MTTDQQQKTMPDSVRRALMFLYSAESSLHAHDYAQAIAWIDRARATVTELWEHASDNQSA